MPDETIITPDQFRALMHKIAESPEGSEYCHRQADELLCYTLILLGYEEGVKIFKQLEKWYA